MHERTIQRSFKDFPQDGHNGPHGLIMAAVCLAVVLLGMWLVYRIFMNSKWANSSQDPLEIAKARYAKGEITKAELVDIKKELKA